MRADDCMSSARNAVICTPAFATGMPQEFVLPLTLLPENRLFPRADVSGGAPVRLIIRTKNQIENSLAETNMELLMLVSPV